VDVSADGKSVYAASHLSNAVVRLSRNTSTGAITQPAGSAGCISETGSGPCADGHGLITPLSVAVSADGKSVYVASLTSDAVVRFNRAP
jgi:DNA-binding beta-propeller fold protein YncE